MSPELPPPSSRLNRPPSEDVPPVLAERGCPHCEYELVGLPRATTCCPECGGSLSPAAFATSAAKRLIQSRTARLVLWISPGVGIVAAIGAYLLRTAGYDAMAALFLCLWAGGAVAVYFSDQKRKSRGFGRAILVGLPVGITYFVVIIGVALALILIVAMFTHAR